MATITGGSMGIGKATALALAQEGAQVAICARGSQALQESASEIRATGIKVLSIRADMTSLDDIQHLVAPEDIAALIRFLVSERASAITG